MKRTIIAAYSLIFLSACSTPMIATPVPIPTMNPVITKLDATLTWTPFQPLLTTETSTPFSVSLTLSTPIPSITPTVTLTPTVFDLDILLPGTWTPPTIERPTYAPTPFPLMTDMNMVTYLLLGSDRRTGTYFRTDSIIIAAFRPRTGEVTLISLPRDLWVYIPTHGMDRINTAFEYGEINGYAGGGPALLKDTILYNLGIRIDHTAVVDFDGFRRIIDALGGIDVPVACPYTDWRLISPDLNPYNENNWRLYTISPGLVHMDGDLALWYARARMRSSDFDRGRRQQEVLRSIYTQILQTDSLSKFPQLYNDLSSSVSTDLTITALLQLAPLAVQLNNADIRSYYIGRGYVTGWTTPAGGSVQLPNGPAIHDLLMEALSTSSKTQDMKASDIEVRNGTTNPGWDALAAERLNYAGYKTRIAPADRTDYRTPLFYDLTTTQDKSLAASIMTILDIPQTALVSAPIPDAGISYVLIVGSDYQPCFDPTKLIP